VSPAGRPNRHDGAVAIPRIDVVGLGPAGPDLVTAGTLALCNEIDIKFLRTQRHPSASVVDGPSFDHHYETLPSFEAVYGQITEDLVRAAVEHHRVLYAVPGSPRVAETTVDLLCARTDIEVVVHGALSFLDLSWVALGVDPIEASVRVVDGHRFAADAAGHSGPLLIAQCHSQKVLSEIKLAVEDPTGLSVVALQRLGADDQRVFDVAWEDLDRHIEPDHLTSIYVPELPVPVSVAFARFDHMVRQLRQECPWDAEQTHASLRRYLLEESYETLEALDAVADAAADPDTDVEVVETGFVDLQEELGDLLYQIFFHAILATEQGWFDVADVARGIYDKLYERHPHVFGDVETSLVDLPAQWEAAKKQEKGRASVMDGIPVALPALLYATKVQKKAIAIGTSAPRPLASSAVSEDDIGALLFQAVALARSLEIDAESALRQFSATFADEVRSRE